LRFAVHCPAVLHQGSPRWHGLSGRDVTCCIGIGMAVEPADYATEARLALTRRRRDMPALAALLAGVPRVNSANSPVRFVFKAREEQAPALRQDAAVEAGLLRDIPTGRLEGAVRRARHGTDVEILDLQDIVAAGEARGRLLHPVLAAGRLVGSEPGDGTLDPSPTVRAPLGAGEAALEPEEALRFLGPQDRRVEALAFTRHHADGDSTVKANDLARPWAGEGCRDVGEGNVPAACGIARHAVRFYAWNRPRLSKAHPADLRHEERRMTTVQSPHMTGLKRDDAEALVTIPLAPRRAPVSAPEEVPFGLVEVSECLLLDDDAALGEPWFSRTQLRELPAQFGVTGRCLSRLPESPLLQTEVPEKPRLTAGVYQHGLLFTGGVQAKAHLGAPEVGIDRPADQFGHRQAGGLGEPPQQGELPLGQMEVDALHTPSIHTHVGRVHPHTALPPRAEAQGFRAGSIR